MKPEDLEGREVIAAVLPGGEIVSLRALDGESIGEASAVPAGTGEGREVYRRGLVLALDLAVRRVYPESRLWVEHSISLGYRCRLENPPADPPDVVVERLDRELARISSEALPVEPVSWPRDREAVESESFSRLAQWAGPDDEVMGNMLSGGCAYALGPAFPDTSWLDRWELRPQGRDFVLRFPGSACWPRISDWRPRPKLAREFDLEEQHCARIGVRDLDQLNSSIERDGGWQVVLMSHFYQTYRMVEIVKELERSYPRRRIITIAGPSSAGKTTFAGLLGTYLKAQGFGARVMNVDNYFKHRRETPRGPDGLPDYECLEAIETELLGEDLAALLDGREVVMPVFDFHEGIRLEGDRPVRLRENEFLLVEGIHGLNDALTPGVDPGMKFRVYTSALTQINVERLTRMSTSDSRLLRRMVRDSTQRGYTAEETIDVWPMVRRGERNNIYPFQENADVMFNSALPYELPVLKPYAEPLLRTVPSGTKAYRTAERLLRLLACVRPIDTGLVPNTSLLREFIGGSILKGREKT